MLRRTGSLPTYLREYRETGHGRHHDLLAVFGAVRVSSASSASSIPGATYTSLLR